MDAYLQTLKTLFEQHANVENSVPMKKYMRNQFEFLGIKSPKQKTLVKQFVVENGLPELSQVDNLIRELWSWPEREYQYVALALLDRLQKRLMPDSASLLENLITTKSWWDTVDPIAIHNVGKLLKQYPEIRDLVLIPWRTSENFWLRRTTLLFQLGYKAATDEALLFALIEENRESTEFFIQKAMGWALREYSKTSPRAVQIFVANTELPSLSQREALKWMKSKDKKWLSET